MNHGERCTCPGSTHEADCPTGYPGRPKLRAKRRAPERDPEAALRALVELVLEVDV